MKKLTTLLTVCIFAILLAGCNSRLSEMHNQKESNSGVELNKKDGNSFVIGEEQSVVKKGILIIPKSILIIYGSIACIIICFAIWEGIGHNQADWYLGFLFGLFWPFVLIVCLLGVLLWLLFCFILSFDKTPSPNLDPYADMYYPPDIQ